MTVEYNASLGLWVVMEYGHIQFRSESAEDCDHFIACS